MAGDYEIIQAVHIGDREIVVGENQADEQGLPYLVAYYESNAILGRYYDAIGSDDFTEIMEIYGQRIMEQAQKTRVELSTPKVQGIDNSPITAERCTPISYDDDLNGKVIVIKPEVLRPEYRRATSQVKLCTGGFGADPHTMAQLPPVHMKLNSDNFDLLMTILEVHAEERDVPGLANDAHDLMDKRMRFSRLCTGPEGQDYVDIFMYESEAVEMIWQLLFAAADADMAVNDYHSRLQRGGIR